MDFFPDTKQNGLARLALPAAAWIILEGYRGATLGGTPDWRSYITFAAAHAWQNRGEAGDELEARRLYAQACEDPRNTAAAINLATLEELDERRAGAVYPDPMQRPSARRLARAVDLTAQRRAADPEAAVRSPDLQWFRARYLLSLSLRDYVDSLRAAADGQATGNEQVAEDAADAALNYAVEMALALVDGRSDLPEDFVRFGRAAAFTLVARQAFPPVTGTNADQIAVAGRDRSDLSEAGLRAALRSLRNGAAKPGTAERIVRYVRTSLPTDDQTEYNMVWYQLTRARILRTAFARWDSVQRRHSGPRSDEEVRRKRTEYRNKVTRWQRMLARQYVIAEREARASRARVERAGDPVLVGLLPPLDEEIVRPVLDWDTRMRELARESDGLDGEDPEDLEPPEENPDFTPSPPSDAPSTSANRRRRPDDPNEAASDSATTQLLPERIVPAPRGEPVLPDQPEGFSVGGNGATVPVSYREDLPRWRQWLRRLIGRGGSGPGGPGGR